MASQITATLPTLDFPKEVDYPTQEDWAAFSAAAEGNFEILGGDWSTQMQLWKDQANAMSIESNNNADIAQALANYQGDWVSQGYTLGQSVSVGEVYYICKLTHATGQNPTDVSSLYWNLALGNWSLKADKTEVALKVNNYGNETIAGVKTFTSSPIVPTPTNNTQAVNKQYADLKVALADFTGANQGLFFNGYQKLPSGLIIQWGTSVSVTNGGGGAGVIYPIAFPTATFQPIICNGDNNIALHNVSVIINQSSNAGFGWVSSIADTEQRVNWIVIGY